MATLAGVEAGGTHFVAAILQDGILTKQEFPTTTPAETLTKVRDWLSQFKYASLGIASFGPVDLRIGSKTYGYITSTPKPNWANTDIISGLRVGDEAIGFDTDVNAAALAEAAKWQVDSLAYMTVGTGVGVGVVVSGQPAHGLLHPEAGHMLVLKMDGDTFEGACPFHGGACVEGNVASGSLAKRAGVSKEDLPSLPDSHPVWEAAAHYLAVCCANVTMTLSPQKIVIGGGVPQRPCLLPMIRSRTTKLLGGYLQHPSLTTSDIDNYIVAAMPDAGAHGAFELARRALQ
eukprot:TRINITY_DN1191_c0_g1_i1.p1 TRINITY_DN1191_c0_g1~~TRINITY_DN1191_c0_g1_i1.p1  ORF type:complete len:289 (+),score=56.34 TRINITY_DN1191_c0_g1_i1:48-914(+)